MEDRSIPTQQHPDPKYSGARKSEPPVRRTVRAGAAIAAVGLLVAGASWRSASAVTSASSPAPVAAIAQTAPTMSRAAAITGRESYADVVKIVAPAVVTIRTEGQAKMAPTDFNSDGETGSADLSILLNGWGTASPDLNADGTVGSADLSILLNAWGVCP